jgi:KUP system potassium uptake protein
VPVILLCNAPKQENGDNLTSEHKKSSLAALTLAAVGIVYGDIGTSPLYTLKTIFDPTHGLALTTPNLLGIVSLIFWGLTMIVSLKYVTLVLRADNRGEGGIMALMALALNSVTRHSRWSYPLMMIGVFGATMFYGDSVITPAISVLGAIEGLEVATPALSHYVVPLTIVVLVILYSVQRHGTAGIGRWFGPIMISGSSRCRHGHHQHRAGPGDPACAESLHAFEFMLRNRFIAFVALGAVVLAFTGAEALYADMGHFGKKPIRSAWFLVVFPALALNYLGQGGLLITHPDAIDNPFFHQLGSWSVIPLVVLSTMAAVIASQATISGTFSMTKQAIALGLLPRMRIMHTSESEIGQIYIPAVNWLQLIVVLIAVVGFGSSDKLAGAYGIAVTATMFATTILTFFVTRYRWHLPLILCIGATGFFMVMDIAVLGQHAEAAARRLVPAAAGRDAADRHADLEARPRTGVREPGKACDPARSLSWSRCSWRRRRAWPAPPSSCAARATACRTRCCTTCRTTRCCTSASCSSRCTSAKSRTCRTTSRWRSSRWATTATS